MEKKSYNPPEGYENGMHFPNAESEEENRKQLNELPMQMLEIFNNFTELLNSFEGAKEVGNKIIEMCIQPDGSYAVNISDQLDIIAKKMVISDNTRYFRANGEGILEYSKDGTHWRSTAGQTGPKGDGIPNGGEIGQWIVKTEQGCAWADNKHIWGSIDGNIDEQIDLSYLLIEIKQMNIKDLSSIVISAQAIWTQLTVTTASAEELENDPELEYSWYTDHIYDCLITDDIDLRPNIPTMNLGVSPSAWTADGYIRIYANADLTGSEVKFMHVTKRKGNRV